MRLIRRSYNTGRQRPHHRGITQHGVGDKPSGFFVLRGSVNGIWGDSVWRAHAGRMLPARGGFSPLSPAQCLSSWASRNILRTTHGRTSATHSYPYSLSHSRASRSSHTHTDFRFTGQPVNGGGWRAAPWAGGLAKTTRGRVPYVYRFPFGHPSDIPPCESPRDEFLHTLYSFIGRAGKGVGPGIAKYWPRRCLQTGSLTGFAAFCVSAPISCHCTTRHRVGRGQPC